MSMVGTKGTWIAALLLSAGLLGGTGLVAGAAQASPAAQIAASGAQCEADLEDEEDESQEDGADDQDNVQEENGADDAAEGDSDADTAEDEAAGDDNGEDGTEDEGAAAKPGELNEGQDLLARAAISVEQAVQSAQGEANGALGSVELEEIDGRLVFEVTVGEQEVFVDATDGSIASVERVQAGSGESDEGCDDEGADGKPGELADGKDLLPQASITLEEAIAAAQAAAPGKVGEIDLEEVDGTLVFVVDVGDADVRIDAATGAVVGTEQEG